jgi:hypothetical protein
MMGELAGDMPHTSALAKEYSSGDSVLGIDEVWALLAENNLLAITPALDED